MTEIGFHFNTPDKVNYACRLVRKAVSARGLRVVVVGEPQVHRAEAVRPARASAR